MDVDALFRRALYDDFPFFVSQIVGPDGLPLLVPQHLEEWGRFIAAEPRIVLLAPRDHGKSTLGLAFLLWQSYRHGRDPRTGLPSASPAGTHSAVFFSATHDQAEVHMGNFRDLVAMNAWLFSDVAVTKARGLRGPRSSSRYVRLRNGAEVRIRAYRTSTRGLHPDLLLLDDVLNDQNSLSKHQRDLTWRYFVSTLLPMNAARLVIMGTSVHYDDLLHRLQPRLLRGIAGGSTKRSPILGFGWHLYRAIDPETETSLWPARHPYAELLALREAEPTMFACEFQNDPRDDKASLFPRELTQRALDAGADLTFLPVYRKSATEFVILGADLALSESVGADYSVIMVASFDYATNKRRILTVSRHKGLSFEDQIDLISDHCRRYGVDLGIVEQNAFQRWLVDELRKRPYTSRIRGHTTGREKTSLADGVPILKLALLADEWIMPSGDADCLEIAKTWQTELSAFGWRDGRLEGLGEHDDMVIASWFLELAVRLITSPPEEPEYEYGDLTDLGIEPVHIGPDY